MRLTPLGLGCFGSAGHRFRLSGLALLGGFLVPASASPGLALPLPALRVSLLAVRPFGLFGWGVPFSLTFYLIIPDKEQKVKG